MMKKYVSALKTNHKCQLITGITAFLFCAVAVFAYLQLNFVTIVEDGTEVASFTTFKEEQAELFTEAQVSVEADDKVVLTEEGQKIYIEISRAFPVNITAGGKTTSVNVIADTTVREALDKAAVAYKETDKFSNGLEEAVEKGMEISVVRCETKVVEETEIIPYEKTTEKSGDLYKGATSVKQKGVNGEKKHVYSVNYEDGVEVARTLTETVVTKEAQNEITLVGTKKRAVSSASYGKKLSKEELAGAKCITVKATAYSSSCDGGAVTCLGKIPSYGTVAVDPRVIPLGTKMYIVSPDGNYVYGYCVAGDTGGAIKGNKVDLFMNSSSACKAFGRRTMLVYILD